MTDEEMAEEYANKAHTHNILNWEKLKQAFLAGLKAGRPQWHDLRKDPTDIPPKKDDTYSIEVWAKDEKGNYGKAVFSYALLEDDGEYSHWMGTIPVLWCELPTFDKE